MKRCPECYFTFEDRVQVCDFDGSELTPFADPAPLSDRIVGPSKKSKLIRFANTRIGLAGLVLLLLVPGVVLIVRHKFSSPPKLDETVWTAERDDFVIATTPKRKSRRRIAYAHNPVRRSRVTIARATTPRRISTPTRTVARVGSSPTNFSISTPTRTTARVRSFPANSGKPTVVLSEKKDSRLNVALKKTGNGLKKTLSVLRKPFGF